MKDILEEILCFLIKCMASILLTDYRIYVPAHMLFSMSTPPLLLWTKPQKDYFFRSLSLSLQHWGGGEVLPLLSSTVLGSVEALYHIDLCSSSEFCILSLANALLEKPRCHAR